MKIIDTGSCLPLLQGYIYVYDFSKIAWPIKAKFYVKPPWEGGKKVYINGSDLITKMATTPIYGKNLQKFSSTELIVL